MDRITRKRVKKFIYNNNINNKMAHLGKFLHTKSGKIIMSILLGFGLATIFRSVCKGKDCITFMAPPLEEIQDKIYQHDNKCYQYKSISTKCNNNKKIIEFDNKNVETHSIV